MIYVPTHDPNVTLSVLASLSRFSTLPETRGMKEWLRNELTRLDEANRHEPDKDVFRQRQGACQVLEALFKLAETADVTAEKIRANRKRE